MDFRHSRFDHQLRGAGRLPFKVSTSKARSPDLIGRPLILIYVFGENRRFSEKTPHPGPDSVA